MTEYIKGIHSIIENYDVILSDIWGVLWDGETVFPDAIETLNAIQSYNKQLILITNAPKSSQWIELKLGQAGLKTDLYHSIVSSGSVCYDYFKAKLPQPHVESIYLEGKAIDHEFFQNLPYRFVDTLEQADCILLMSLHDDEVQLTDYDDWLEKAAHYKLPLYCANPDLCYIDQNGQRLMRAGEIAKRYQDYFNGSVNYFGKPYSSIYQACLNKVVSSQRILAIGDSIEHDIVGANNMGIDSLLVKSGVSQHLSVEHCLSQSNAQFLIDTMRW